MAFSSAHSAAIAPGTTRSASYRLSGSSPNFARVAWTAAPAKRPVSSLVARFAAACAPRPRVLARGVQYRAGEVQPGRIAGRVDDLRLEPGQDAQGLGVALEAA